MVYCQPDRPGVEIGNLLLEKATFFVDQTESDCTRLWTFKGLDAARYLYKKHSYVIVDETPN